MVRPLGAGTTGRKEAIQPLSVSSKGAAMNDMTTTAPVFSQNGRKGISYDWQSLYAEAQAELIDCELRELAPALAE